MWRKNDGHMPTGDVVQVKLRGGTILPINEKFPKEGRRWWFAKNSTSEVIRAINDVIEYDDGQEPEGQGNDFSEAHKMIDEPVRLYSSTFSAVPVVKKMFGITERPNTRLMQKEVPHDALHADLDARISALRTFETGATRHNDSDKYDYEGFLSPIALEAFAAYMHVNRRTVDGGLRDSDNWQKGIPVTAYMKSKWRHDFEMWKAHRGYATEEGELAAACGVLFNTMGWIHEKAKADPGWFERELEKFKQYRAAEIAARAK